MNLPFFIAHRIAFSKNASFAKWIIRIATAAIAISLAVMIITTAVITGFKNQITEKLFGFWGHIHILDTNINRTFEPIPVRMNASDLEALRQVDRVAYHKPEYDFGSGNAPRIEILELKGTIEHVQSFAIAPGIIKTRSDVEGILLKGVGPDQDWEKLGRYIRQGRAVEWQDSAASRDILISQETARRLQLSVGDPLRIYFVKERNQIGRRFNICGIYKTGLEEYDRKFAIVDIRMVQGVLGWEPDQVGGYEVFVDDLSDLEMLNEYIYMEVLPPRLYSESIRTRFPSIFEWLELQNINEDVILLLMIIVSIINMATALLILILERTQMIGALKALGSTNWTIRKVFLFHAAYIIGRGILIGNIIGLLFCYLQDRFEIISLDERNYYLSTAPIELNIWSLVVINLATVAITLLFLILPTYIVTRITPVQALRFD